VSASLREADVSAPLLDVHDLRVAFATPHGPVQAVDGVSFQLRPGEVLAIVGESGSGKSVCALTLMGLTRGPHTTVQGSARLEGEQLIGASERRLRALRGARMAMVFQDPQSSLNPVLRVGPQIAEQILAHEPSVGRAHALRRAAELMERVGIGATVPGDRRHSRARSYPHELSGGMRQRAMIAMALSLGARVLLADEPTTALDVTVQAQILALLREVRDQTGMGIVLVTHDFGVVAEIADRVAVMRAGRIVEDGPVARVLNEPRHPYTRALLSALSPPARRSGRPSAGEPLVQVRDVTVSFPVRGSRAHVQRAGGWLRARSRLLALNEVSLDVREGETLAVVGESGSGKTTLIRAIARLIEPDSGAIRFAGAELTKARARKLAHLRRSLGMVFQDPHASLNPRRRVGATLELALRARGLRRPGARVRALELLERVGLSAGYAVRFPHQLSGGERQRVGIARALAGGPRLVLLDEPVSSLDASLRRGVIELLAELQEQVGCSYMLVSHDLAMVAGVADRIAVMRAGEVVELGDAEEVLQRPRHSYTRELLAARPPELGGVGSNRWAPRISPGSDLQLRPSETSSPMRRGSSKS
jgi:peptide/nickel transport system ATP-binding protein